MPSGGARFKQIIDKVESGAKISEVGAVYDCPGSPIDRRESVPIMRIGIISLIHESNAFIRKPTTLEMFRRNQLLSGKQMYAHCSRELGEVRGFIDGLEASGAEPVPIFFARTPPSGPITAETCEALMEMLFEQLERAGQLDGILANPHGANMGVGAEYRDLDGHWLKRLRDTVGPSLPILCVIDPHCNLSPRMVDACNAIIAYRTNPHLDQMTRGLEASRMMIRMLQGEINPVQAASFPAVSINIEKQRTDSEPCLSMYRFAGRLREQPGVLSNSIVLGYPYSDFEEMGSSVIAVTDDDPNLARQQADRLAQYLVEHRHDFVGDLIDVETAVDRALAQEGPVCLLDMGDNIGGGSTADGTFLAHELHRREGVRAYVCLYDPESVREAEQAGIGAVARLRMGGKVDDQHGPPLEVDVEVKSFHEGRFKETEIRHGGRTQFDMGRTAIVETDRGLTVCLTSRSCAPISLGIMTSCGLKPEGFQVVVAKGVQSPVPAFEPFCTKLIRVNTSGSTTADTVKLDYQYRRKPLFPFEEIEPYPPPEAGTRWV